MWYHRHSDARHSTRHAQSPTRRLTHVRAGSIRSVLQQRGCFKSSTSTNESSLDVRNVALSLIGHTRQRVCEIYMARLIQWLTADQWFLFFFFFDRLSTSWQLLDMIRSRVLVEQDEALMFVFSLPFSVEFAIDTSSGQLTNWNTNSPANWRMLVLSDCYANSGLSMNVQSNLFFFLGERTVFTGLSSTMESPHGQRAGECTQWKGLSGSDDESDIEELSWEIEDDDDETMYCFD
jgi:hypothetical protein